MQIFSVIDMNTHKITKTFPGAKGAMAIKPLMIIGVNFGLQIPLMINYCTNESDRRVRLKLQLMSLENRMDWYTARMEKLSMSANEN